MFQLLKGQNMNQPDAQTIPNYVTSPYQHRSSRIEFDASQSKTPAWIMRVCPQPQKSGETHLKRICVVPMLRIRHPLINHRVAPENQLPMVNYEWDYFAENTACFFNGL
jgi:hypothetical protein